METLEEFLKNEFFLFGMKIHPYSIILYEKRFLNIWLKKYIR